MAMKLDHEDLNRLIEKISKSDIQEFLLEGEDFKLEIKRNLVDQNQDFNNLASNCLLYTSPSPRDGLLSRMPSSA